MSNDFSPEYYRSGEYVYTRSPQEIQDLRQENRSQNERLQRVENQVSSLRVALVGIDGGNGMRRELQEHKQYTAKKLDEIETKLDKIIPAITRAVVTAITVIGVLVGIAAALYRIFGG